MERPTHTHGGGHARECFCAARCCQRLYGIPPERVGVDTTNADMGYLDSYTIKATKTGIHLAFCQLKPVDWACSIHVALEATLELYVRALLPTPDSGSFTSGGWYDAKHQRDKVFEQLAGLC